MSRLLIAGLLALTAAWLVHAQSGAPTTATLRAVSACAGAPVPFVEVSADGRFLGTTDAAGVITLPIVTGTAYALTLYQGQFAPWHGSFRTDGAIALTITLQRVAPGC